MKIVNGWLDEATRHPTPNKQSGFSARELIVMHYTAGYTAQSALSTLASPASRASAHFVVGTDGQVWQMVSGLDTAWHSGQGVFAGKSAVNSRSIGIELVNPGYHFRDASGQILNWQKKPVSPERLRPFPGMMEASDPWVGSRPALWPHYPEAQLQGTERLVLALCRAFPALQSVAGHRDVDSKRKLKVDPGPAFPMPRFQTLLAPPLSRVAAPGTVLNIRTGPAANFPALPQGPLADGQMVQEVERQGKWVRVSVKSRGETFAGWVNGAYLSHG